MGFSSVLYLQQLRGKWVDKFIIGNTLDIEARNLLLLTLVLGAGFAMVLPGAFLLWKRSQAAVERIQRLARILSPLVVVGAIPAIFRWKPWTEEPIGLSVAILVVGFILEKTLRLSLEAFPENRWRGLAHRLIAIRDRFPRLTHYAPLLIVVAGSLFYAIFMSVMALRLHWRLETRAFDLGGYQSLFVNALSGHPFRCPANVMPTGDWSSLKGHAEISIYALLPLYALYPRAETLLVIQSSLLGLAAIPLSLTLARHLPRSLAAVVALGYLAFPSLQAANLFDFHMQPVAIFFVLWVIYFLDARRYVWLAIALPIALGCREDIGIGLTIGAIFLVFSGYRPIAGAIVALVSVCYFVVMKFILMPMAGEWWFENIYKDLFPPGQATYFGVVKTLLTNPIFVLKTLLTQDKLIHILRILTPVFFLPLRRTALWWLLIPGAFFTILTTGYKPTVSPTFQYVGHWIPYLFVATGLALAAIGKYQGKIHQAAASITLIVVTLACTYNWGAMMQRNHMVAGWGRVQLGPLTEEEKVKLQQLEELIALIPVDASVGASETEHPHFYQQITVQTLRYSYDKPDYILYRINTGKFGSDHGKKQVNEGNYVQIESRGPFILLERKDRISKN